MLQYDKKTIEADIKKVAASEKITKAKLSSLSRSLLAYVYDTNDVGMVTRLLKVLTPVNKQVAAQYFANFLGWSFDEASLEFGKKAKEKTFSRKHEQTKAWLEDEANDIWRWAADNIEVKVKPKDYANKITQLVTKALSDEDEGIEAKDVINAILASDKLTLADVLASINPAAVELADEKAA